MSEQLDKIKALQDYTGGKGAERLRKLAEAQEAFEKATQGKWCPKDSLVVSEDGEALWRIADVHLDTDAAFIARAHNLCAAIFGGDASASVLVGEEKSLSVISRDGAVHLRGVAGSIDAISPGLSPEQALTLAVALIQAALKGSEK